MLGGSWTVSGLQGAMEPVLCMMLMYALFVIQVPVAEAHTYAAGTDWYVGDVGNTCDQVCASFGLTCENVFGRTWMPDVDTVAELELVWNAIPAQNFVAGANTAMTCTTDKTDIYSVYPWYEPGINECGIPQIKSGGNYGFACSTSASSSGHPRQRICPCIGTEGYVAADVCGGSNGFTEDVTDIESVCEVAATGTASIRCCGDAASGRCLGGDSISRVAAPTATAAAVAAWPLSWPPARWLPPGPWPRRVRSPGLALRPRRAGRLLRLRVPV